MLRFYAPYKKFRVVVDDITLFFPNGSREVQESDKAEIMALKKVPISIGEIRDLNGHVVNAPKKKISPKPSK